MLCRGTQVPDGTRVGQLPRSLCERRRREEIPIIYAYDARDSAGELPGVPVDVRGAVIAWRGANPASRRQGNMAIRLFKRTWNNPAPEVEVAKIDFVAEHGWAHPFLVALTAE